MRRVLVLVLQRILYTDRQYLMLSAERNLLPNAQHRAKILMILTLLQANNASDYRHPLPMKEHRGIVVYISVLLSLRVTNTVIVQLNRILQILVTT